MIVNSKSNSKHTFAWPDVRWNRTSRRFSFIVHPGSPPRCIHFPKPRNSTIPESRKEVHLIRLIDILKYYRTEQVVLQLGLEQGHGSFSVTRLIKKYTQLVKYFCKKKTESPVKILFNKEYIRSNELDIFYSQRETTAFVSLKHDSCFSWSSSNCQCNL